MKLKIIFTVGSLLGFGAICQADVGEIKVNFKVMDESGKPMPNVDVGCAFVQSKLIAPVTGNDLSEKQIYVATDVNGQAIVDASSVCNNNIYYSTKQVSGYYEGGNGEVRFLKVDHGEWQPWNSIVEIRLRPVLNPVPMYAKKTGNLIIPEIGKPVGYDLMVGDLVSPYGKGFKSNLVFILERKPDKIVKTDDFYKRKVKLFDATLKVTFSNPDDGIQAIPVIEEYKGSQFSIPRFAPENDYQLGLANRIYRESAAKPIVEPEKAQLGFFYRVRSVRQDGKIVSAQYGKMSNINFDVINSPTAVINFTYYLNPELNSRNMEFDPKHDLFNNLNEFEQVSSP
jgi:hypothetical protein